MTAAIANTLPINRLLDLFQAGCRAVVDLCLGQAQQLVAVLFEPCILSLITSDPFGQTVPIIAITLNHKFASRNEEITDPVTQLELRNIDNCDRSQHCIYSSFNTGSFLRHSKHAVDGCATNAAKLLRRFFAELCYQSFITVEALSKSCWKTREVQPAIGTAKAPTILFGFVLCSKKFFSTLRAFNLCSFDARATKVKVFTVLAAILFPRFCSRGDKKNLFTAQTVLKSPQVSIAALLSAEFRVCSTYFSDRINFAALLAGLLDWFVRWFQVILFLWSLTVAIQATPDFCTRVCNKISLTTKTSLVNDVHAFGFSSRRFIGGARSPKYRVSPSDQEGIAPSLFYLGGVYV